MPPNTFDEVLGLEEEFYATGFQQGLTDGLKAGRIEGRTFGLEKGFEKYVESGKLHGRSLIWSNQVRSSKSTAQQKRVVTDTPIPRPSSPVSEPATLSPTSLPRLPSNQRLLKHIKVLHALSEPESLSTENDEESVTDFDDRLKRAQGKAKVIERIVGGANGDNMGIGAEL
ncbi:DUF1715-domain-containing protein [Mollisia scopiformis]|uniref:DUF1715-domain-containing protein n=1 Tax=Mollisia scopiformis TaxID=149040 RepID=A0A194WWD1_MOLSC|nr:DUF1715-domain-containing protein [Mollisia scopiformis]KUJ11979.1 DUF1715-domain-containing protein [Mollisia scopiformis]